MNLHPILTILLTSSAVRLTAADSAIPAPVSSADYGALLERPPFRRVLSLSESLVLSGVASLPDKRVVTVWDRNTGRSFIVSDTPNPQGWKLMELTQSTDLRSVAATITAGEQKITLRFDPERLIPPKLDNTSKPAPRSEGAVVVEALLRSLDPAAAKDFEGMPATSQETFRKSFSEFLATYPTASDARRLAFVRRALDDSRPEEGTDGAAAESPANPPPPAPPKETPASSSPPLPPAPQK